jgi:hypothetical protein
MRTSLSKGKYNLVIMAHPDDESIFLAGTILQNRKLPWYIICVTDANADQMGEVRNKQFHQALKALNSNGEIWNFPDIYENRLNIEKIEAQLSELPTPSAIYTHNILGEYGHPHHQDISYACQKFYHQKCSIFCVGQNAFPDLVTSLNKESFKIKAEILSDIYGSETQRFSHLLPITSFESFVRPDFKESEFLYQYFLGKTTLNNCPYYHYHHLAGHLKLRGPGISKRLF